jgi:hypothetical protein
MMRRKSWEKIKMWKIFGRLGGRRDGRPPLGFTLVTPAKAHYCPGFKNNKIVGNFMLKRCSYLIFLVMRGLDPRIASQPLC